MPSLAEIALAGGRAQAEGIRDRGQIEANRRAATGAIWGNTIASIGQTVGQGLLAWQQQRDAQKQAQAAADDKAFQTAKDQAVAQMFLGSIEQDDSGVSFVNFDKFKSNVEQSGIPLDTKTLMTMFAQMQSDDKAHAEAQLKSFQSKGRAIAAMGNTPQVFAALLHLALENKQVEPGMATSLLTQASEHPEMIAKMTAALLGEKDTTPADEWVSVPGGMMNKRTGEEKPTSLEKPPDVPKPANSQAIDFLLNGKVVQGDYVPGVGGQPGHYFYNGEDVTGRAQKAPTAAQTAATEVPENTIDPESQSILSQTGLSQNAFLALTGQLTKLPRDAATRTKANAEMQQWAKAHNVDTSTLPAQYDAYMNVVKSNITRVSMTKIMEEEVRGTLENLQAVTATDFSGLRWANVAKLWAGKQVNDPQAQQYLFHLQQLRTDLTNYFAATQGRSGNQITDSDKKDAEDVIANGVAKESLTGLLNAVEASRQKMDVVLGRSVDRARKAVWDLFGVGQNYKASGGTQAGKKLTAEELIKKYGGG